MSAASVSALWPRDRDLGAGTAAGVAATGGDLDLRFALRAEADWAEAVGGLEVRIVVAGPAVLVERGLADDVIWAAREALTRVARDADARSVRIGLLYDADGVSLLVQDDGRGFDLSSDLPARHVGLCMIAERVRELGATVEIDSLPGWGSRIRARFPYGRDPRSGLGWMSSSPRAGPCSGPGWPGWRATTPTSTSSARPGQPRRFCTRAGPRNRPWPSSISA